MKNSNLKKMSLLALTFVVSNVCSANKFDSINDQLIKIETRSKGARCSGLVEMYKDLKEAVDKTNQLIPTANLEALVTRDYANAKDIAPYKAVNYTDRIAEIRKAIATEENQVIVRAEQARQEQARLVELRQQEALRAEQKAQELRNEQAKAEEALFDQRPNELEGDLDEMLIPQSKSTAPIQSADNKGSGIVKPLVIGGAALGLGYITKKAAEAVGNLFARAEKEADSLEKDKLFFDAEEGRCELLTEKEADLDDEQAEIEREDAEGIEFFDAKENQEIQTPAQTSRLIAIIKKIGSNQKRGFLRNLNFVNPGARLHRCVNHLAAVKRYLSDGQKTNAIKSLALASYDLILTATILTAIGYTLPVELTPAWLSSYLGSIHENILEPSLIGANSIAVGLSSAATAIATKAQILYANYANEMCLTEESPGTCDAPEVVTTDATPTVEYTSSMDKIAAYAQESTWSYGSVFNTAAASLLTLIGGGIYMNQ